jgi:hypothetical protein
MFKWTKHPQKVGGVLSVDEKNRGQIVCPQGDALSWASIFQGMHRSGDALSMGCIVQWMDASSKGCIIQGMFHPRTFHPRTFYPRTHRLGTHHLGTHRPVTHHPGTRGRITRGRIVLGRIVMLPVNMLLSGITTCFCLQNAIPILLLRK